MTAPTIDEVFGDYRLTHLLGKGGMASVYRAVRSGPMGFAKQVAIKRLHSSLTRDSAILKALVNEARIGGQLKHPNIVEIYEFNRVGDTYFLAMEFVDGWTLDRVLHLSRKYKKPLPQEVVLDMAIQICDGLHYAHTIESLDGTEVHLVHRDLKPANIILSRDGATKIMDFGIAKADTNLFKTTMVDTTKGTPHYMSPEQVGGDPNLGPTSDIFALGSLLYELSTDKILFTGDSLASVLFAVSRAEVAEQIDEVEGKMPGLGEIVRRCVHREPTDRYPSAKALKEALVQLRDSREEGPWTTQNYMYTLRSELLATSASGEATSADGEVDFGALLGSGHGLERTDEVSVEQTRQAADAEIHKLQDQYLSDALNETVAVDGLDPTLHPVDPPITFEAVPAEDIASPTDPQLSRTRIAPHRATTTARPTAPSQGALLAILGVALLLTLTVLAVRMLAPGDTAPGEAVSQAGGDEAAAGLATAAGERGTDSGSAKQSPSPPALHTGPPKTATPASPDSGDRGTPADSTAAAAPPAPQVAGAAAAAVAAAARPEASEPSLEAGARPKASAAAPASEEQVAEVATRPRATGKLGVRASTPSSTVFVDGRLVGKTPLMPFALSEGKHNVRLHCATAGVDATKSITVTIEAGKTLKLGKYNFMTQQWK
jgi:serine/threonine-protein kinase